MPIQSMEVDLSTSTPEELSARTAPRGWLAALLTFLAPGAGHLYAGHVRRGILLHLASYVIVTALVAVFVYGPSGAAVVILPLIVVFAYVLFVAVDAWRSASRPTFLLRRRRWMAAAALVLFSVVVGDAYLTRLRSAAGEAFRISSTSMEPTLLAGDYVYIEAHSPTSVRRDQLLVWDASIGPRLQRVVGLPGDTLQMTGQRLLRNGAAVAEPYAQYDPEVSDSVAPRRWGPLVVPQDSVFLLGDNRDNSYDSRYVGFVPVDSARGRPTRIYLSRDPTSSVIRWSRIGSRIEHAPPTA